MRRVEVAIIGAGAAGLSLADRLAGRLAGGRRPVSSVLVIEAPPGPIRPPVRTWCFWEEPDGEWDDVVRARWEHLRVIDSWGRGLSTPIAPLVYKMISSADYARAVGERLDPAVASHLEATVHRVIDAPRAAIVEARDAAGQLVRVAARWVFDSRPRPVPAPATTLLQHFRGWFVTAERPVFDPVTADLMDLRTPQPAVGVSFGYLLPFAPDRALVEYTEFTPAVLDDAAYERALRAYTRDTLGLDGLRVTGVEQGVIPMTDARLPRRYGRRVFPIGAAAGATRPSTGYTFAAIQCQTRAIARALTERRTPAPRPGYPRHHLWMDALLLRALATGQVGGAELFTDLFAATPLPAVLHFLAGNAGLRRELAVASAVPPLPMLRALTRRPAPHPGTR